MRLSHLDLDRRRIVSHWQISSRYDRAAITDFVPDIVQAAMRLRQLGSTQSVTFWAPPEVHQSILDVTGKRDMLDKLDSKDVILWLLHQTCVGIEALRPLCIHQGRDYCRRAQSAIDNPRAASDEKQRAAYLAILEQTENVGGPC